MELNFVNGTTVQKAACRTAAHSLLNLPMDTFPLVHTVEFTPDPLPSSHSEFAVTEVAYDSLEAFTQIASIAPNWPEPWSGINFLQETYAHELGHALFAQLPHEVRVAVVELFGESTDDPSVVYDESKAWEDRAGEGIAETFKEAFVPRQLRRYPNRTNRKLSFSKYPEFRRLWREGAPEVAIEEEEGEEVFSPFVEFIERGGSHPWREGASSTFLQELIAACGATDALFGPLFTGGNVPLLQGRHYVAAEILRPPSEQAPYLSRLRKAGEVLSVFLWMEVPRWNRFDLPGENLVEKAYLESGKTNTSPLPVGTRLSTWFDFTIQIVWRRADGTLLPGAKMGFRYENEEELVSYNEFNIRPPWGDWEDVGTVYENFFYNDEGSGNPTYSEHPELDFTVPANATAIAGFLVGTEQYLEEFLVDEGTAPFFEHRYAEVDRARSSVPKELFFSLPGFVGGGSVIVGEGQAVLLPESSIDPQHATAGTRRLRHRVSGFHVG